MATTSRTGEKRTALEHLDYTPRTLKRVEWESWEFTVIGPHLIEVTNASYGFEKDDHSYTVGVEVRDGVAVPSECECPADVHHDSDCKHRTALAIVGGPTVLDAAVDFDGPSPVLGVATDGGCACDGDRLPCFDCYTAGRRELPE
jgi:hypothetical protein